VAAACRDEALDLVAQIELLNGHIKAAEARMDELLERHPDREILRSLPGLGNRLSVRVVAELGDSRDRFRDRSSLQAFAGTAPVTRRSGKRGVMSINMRKGCNRTLQAALFTMARCSLARSRWARAYYDSVRARGVRHAAAVRSLSNKWAKFLHAVLTSREPYDDERHLARLLECAVAWALPLAEEAA
jgi:transposase